MARVGFLFNHFTTHQVAHSAPVAFELSSVRGDMEVFILASCERQLAMADRIGQGWPTHRVRFEKLQQTKPDRLINALGCQLDRGAKRRVLRANRKLLTSMDALVVPERTSAALRHMPGFEGLKLILIPHGAGDRAVGYENRNAAFDLVLVAGDKCRKRMIAEAGVAPDRVQVIGYPKFDIPFFSEDAASFFAEPRHTVLYNPHFHPTYSSWLKFGDTILEYFANQDRHNLIFAPHVLLWRNMSHRQIHRVEQYQDVPHIHVDMGSDRCVDMTYTRLADTYLGDVSSQIYEFIVKPRRAVFLDAHGRRNWDADPSYKHWSLGTVLDDPSRLDQVLRKPLLSSLFDRQREASRQTFHVGSETASRIGADAIFRCLTTDLEVAGHVRDRRAWRRNVDWKATA